MPDTRWDDGLTAWDNVTRWDARDETLWDDGLTTWDGNTTYWDQLEPVKVNLFMGGA